MRRSTLLPTLLLATITVFGGRLLAAGTHDATVDQFFTPPLNSSDTDCKGALVSELLRAQHRILIQAFRFTDRSIAMALVGARRRGVEVAVVVDADMEIDPFSQAPYLLAMGIPVRTDDEHAYAHNTVVLIDNDEVITGSYNPTPTATKYNAENLVIVHSTLSAAAFGANFQQHAGHSRPFLVGGHPLVTP
jgi:phosphatidylserine/phosphatidylglycerophosphate/cardiolipin synthase-like enzyme